MNDKQHQRPHNLVSPDKEYKHNPNSEYRYGEVNVIYTFEWYKQEHCDIEFSYIKTIDEENFVRLLLRDLHQNSNHTDAVKHLVKISTCTKLISYLSLVYGTANEHEWNPKSLTGHQHCRIDKEYENVMNWLGDNNGKWHFDSHQYLLEKPFVRKLRQEWNVGCHTQGYFDKFPEGRDRSRQNWIVVALKKLAIDCRTNDKDFFEFRNLLDGWKSTRSKKKQKQMECDLARALSKIYPPEKDKHLSLGRPIPEWGREIVKERFFRNEESDIDESYNRKVIEEPKEISQRKVA